MTPGQVRDLIRSEHTVIASRLDILAESLSLPPEQVLTTAFRTQVEAFAGRLLVHMAHEEAYLVPVLAESTNWGPINLSELRAHHDRQRADIGRVIRALGDADAPRDELLASLRALLDDVRQDLRDEDEHLLTDDMVRDDVVSINASGG